MADLLRFEWTCPHEGIRLVYIWIDSKLDYMIFSEFGARCAPACGHVCACVYVFVVRACARAFVRACVHAGLACIMRSVVAHPSDPRCRRPGGIKGGVEHFRPFRDRLATHLFNQKYSALHCLAMSDW